MIHELEGQLVALIPVKDKRLKPSRTHLYVCLAVVLCLTAAGLLMFFLFSRDVIIVSSKPYLRPSNVTINITKEVVTFSTMNYFDIRNDNYFSVSIKGVKMDTLYDTLVITSTQNQTVIDIPMRSSRKYFVQANITLDKANELGYMAVACTNAIRWAHEMVMTFEITVNYTGLGHSEQATLSPQQYVSCYPGNQTSHLTHYRRRGSGSDSNGVNNGVLKFRYQNVH